MNKKYKIIWTALIVILTVGLLVNITGCSTTKDVAVYSGERIFELESLLRLKTPFIISQERIEDSIDQSQTTKKQAKLMEIVKWDGKFIRNEKLSKEEAIEDVTDYFNHLKDCYAGYLSNGGDEEFLKAKKEIIDNIFEGITCQELKIILRDGMSFVNDAHFLIGDFRRNDKNRSWHYVDDLYLGKDEKGLFDIASKKYIKNSKDIEAFLKPSLTVYGELAYIVAVYGNEIESLPQKIQFDNGQEIPLSIKRSIGQQEDHSGPIYEKLNGLNYLKLQRFYFPNEEEEVKILLEAAKEMGESSLSILDLRGNIGGNGILADQWTETYSGKKVQYSFNGTYILSEESMDSASNGQSWKEYIKHSNCKVYDDNHTITEASEEMLEIENVLIVLTDSSMFSASELLTDSLHHLNKTIFIGMPTFGCINSSLMFNAVLKNSNIPFGFGNSWNIFDEDYYMEFKGFQPDIWMPEIDIESFSKFLFELE